MVVAPHGKAPTVQMRRNMRVAPHVLAQTVYQEHGATWCACRRYWPVVNCQRIAVLRVELAEGVEHTFFQGYRSVIQIPNSFPPKCHAKPPRAQASRTGITFIL